MKLVTNRGFTLIELLLVISIIGLLTSISVVSLAGVRDRARDARRLTEMKQLQALLEIFNEENGSYPTTPDDNFGLDGSYPWIISNGPAGFTYYNSCKRADWIPGMAAYTPVLPRESINTLDRRCFMYGSDGNDYRLIYYNVEGMDCSPPNSSACDANLIAAYGGFFNGVAFFTEGARNWTYGD